MARDVLVLGPIVLLTRSDAREPPEYPDVGGAVASDAAHAEGGGATKYCVSRGAAATARDSALARGGFARRGSLTNRAFDCSLPSVAWLTRG